MGFRKDQRKEILFLQTRNVDTMELLYQGGLHEVLLGFTPCLIPELRVHSQDQELVVSILTDIVVVGDMVCSGDKRTFQVDVLLRPNLEVTSCFSFPVPARDSVSQFSPCTLALRWAYEPCFSLLLGKGDPGAPSSALRGLCPTGCC